MDSDESRRSEVWVSDDDPAFVVVIERAAIGDRVWLDADGDGVQDVGEVSPTW